MIEAFVPYFGPSSDRETPGHTGQIAEYHPDVFRPGPVSHAGASASGAMAEGRGASSLHKAGADS